MKREVYQCGLCGAFLGKPPADGSKWVCAKCRTEWDNPYKPRQ